MVCEHGFVLTLRNNIWTRLEQTLHFLVYFSNTGTHTQFKKQTKKIKNCRPNMVYNLGMQFTTGKYGPQPNQG